MKEKLMVLDMKNIAAQCKAEQLTYLSDKLTELTLNEEIELKQLIYEIDNIGLLLLDCASDLTEHLNNCDNIIHNLRNNQK